MDNRRVAVGKRYNVPVEQVRDVWQAVTENPTISVREIASRTGLSYSKTQAILGVLEEALYIRHQRGKERARTAVIPLVAMREG